MENVGNELDGVFVQLILLPVQVDEESIQVNKQFRQLIICLVVLIMHFVLLKAPVRILILFHNRLIS